MKQLKDILIGFKFEVIQGDNNVSVSGLKFDSRKVSQGDVFFAIRGEMADGHDYINSAIDLGCRCIVSEKNIEYQRNDLTVIIVEDSSAALALMASAFYDFPSSQINLIGITGTNGKTTTATLLHDLYRQFDYKCG